MIQTASHFGRALKKACLVAPASRQRPGGSWWVKHSKELDNWITQYREKAQAKEATHVFDSHTSHNQGSRIQVQNSLKIIECVTIPLWSKVGQIFGSRLMISGNFYLQPSKFQSHGFGRFSIMHFQWNFFCKGTPGVSNSLFKSYTVLEQKAHGVDHDSVRIRDGGRSSLYVA